MCHYYFWITLATGSLLHFPFPASRRFISILIPRLTQVIFSIMRSLGSSIHVLLLGLSWFLHHHHHLLPISTKGDDFSTVGVYHITCFQFPISISQDHSVKCLNYDKLLTPRSQCVWPWHWCTSCLQPSLPSPLIFTWVFPGYLNHSPYSHCAVVIQSNTGRHFRLWSERKLCSLASG